MRPPRSAPVPGLIVGLRLLRRRPLPLHIPTRSDLSGWSPLGPKVKGCPALRGGTSGANKLTGFSAVQSDCAADTQLFGDSLPTSASLGVACAGIGDLTAFGLFFPPLCALLCSPSLLQLEGSTLILGRPASPTPQHLTRDRKSVV